MSQPPLQVVNLSDLNPPWNWVGHRFHTALPRWMHCSSLPASRWGVPASRLRALACAMGQVRRHGSPSILVSHGPRPTHLWASLGQRWTPAASTLAFSFNFTMLPTGRQHVRMARSFRRVDRFVVASTVERDLYATHFGLDPARIDLLLWGVQPPLAEMHRAPLQPGDYICALGSQGRDYATLIDAMRRLPGVQLVLVATPDALPAGPLPDNVQVLTHIPRSQAMNLLAHSRLMVLPMRDSQVPCGHVTAVSAMHMGKAIVATDTVGLHDYLHPGHNALLAAPRDPVALAARIEQLLHSPDLAAQMGRASQHLASTHCTEAAVCEYFQRHVQATFGWTPTIDPHTA